MSRTWNDFSKILISKKEIENISYEYIRKNKLSSTFTLLLGLVIPLWFTLFISNTTENHDTIIICGTILIIMTITVIVLGIYIYMQRHKKDLVLQINEKAENDADYTAIFIISKIFIDNDGKRSIELLVQEKKSWGCDFLPYLKMDKDISIEDQTNKLKKGLANIINVDPEIIEIFKIDSAYSIKFSVPENTEKLYRYVFFTVSISKHLHLSLINNQKWVSIDTLLNDVNVIRINGDVVDNLNKLRSKITDSFSNKNNFIEPIKIIWNITSKCHFNCSICGTYNQERSELTESQKYQALVSILTIKDSIRELDFAGGDPLMDPDSIKIIMNSVDFLGKNRVSITTTGHGIENLSDEIKLQILSNCELTIDNPDPDEDSTIRMGRKYNNINAVRAQIDRKFMSKLTINVPILDTNIDHNRIVSLVKRINSINPQEVVLIRLMPVGKVNLASYPSNYNPDTFINTFKNNLEKNIILHLQCALRCKYSDGCYCNMLQEKIGIDCCGNVFACAWAAYLDCNVHDNPFYIGNLINKSLKDILLSNEANEIRQRLSKNHKHCCIFSYVTTKGKSFFSENDPLLK